MPTCSFYSLLLIHMEFIVYVTAVEKNDNEVTNCFCFIPANVCEYDDAFSNCKDLKSQLGCENDFVTKNCKAACNCSKKIY